jgi:hypothetical protein
MGGPTALGIERESEWPAASIMMASPGPTALLIELESEWPNMAGPTAVTALGTHPT